MIGTTNERELTGELIPCRLCGSPLSETFVDLGSMPLANAFVPAEQLECTEPTYPLKAYVCGDCMLVQLEAFESPQAIFSDYPYFSSYTRSWLDHAENYAMYAAKRFCLKPDSQVVEIASNDGYLLQYFKKLGVKVLGVDPAANIAKEANAKGIPTKVEFFGAGAADRLREEGFAPDLMIANNVLAHVPDVNDFVAGFRTLLKPEGVATFEFPHLLQLIQQCQFDTIYHEHLCYLSLAVVKRLFISNGLRIFDVQELPTHGGSLRVFACHEEDSSRSTTDRVPALLEREASQGLLDLATYRRFASDVETIRSEIRRFLIDAKNQGKVVCGYGAPAKGNTLLNSCGANTKLIRFTTDRNPNKQGLYLPGTHIPIYEPARIFEEKPDYVFILPWNLADEIRATLAEIKSWGARFVLPIPKIEILC